MQQGSESSVRGRGARLEKRSGDSIYQQGCRLCSSFCVAYQEEVGLAKKQKKVEALLSEAPSWPKNNVSAKLKVSLSQSV